MRTFAAVVCALAAAALLSAPAAAAPRYSIIALSHADRTVYEVAPDTGRILHALAMPADPHAAAVSPDGRTIYVSIPTLGLVDVIDARTFTIAGRLDSPSFRRPPVKGPDGRTTTSALPSGLALTSDGTKLYVGLRLAPGPALVDIDLRTKQSRPVDLGLQGAGAFAIQPGTDWLYAPFRADNRVVVLDTGDNRRIATIRVDGGPAGVGFAPNGDVWFNGDADGGVAVASSMTNRIERVLRTGGRGIGRVAVSPDGRYVASTHSGSRNVAILDARGRRMLATVPTGNGPAFPIFSPDSTTLFVMNRGQGDIAVIDLKTMKVTARWKVGTDPFGGALRFLGRPSPR